ncbi:hypothetical protein N0V93_006458 [Gnomoniopsis smithogilvyi]|uniref:Uncharacterized protein n=1 Tax=Gnomoniopsis smithogilvyi TaxID=1191159 RepID=A0A9W8YPP1_9PEZI|nr:hypothetical protein N0V93_006458 [Gnomoniopsis smithogilvyi]
MSATTTDNPISTTLHRAAHADHLQDYEVHLNSDGATPAPPNTDNRPSAPSASNPEGWYDEHRGVPPYRPINRNLDLSQRPWGGNPVGDAFVFTMFTGVFTVANLNWLWRNTGGRVNDRIFRYKVGGEV